MAKEGNLSARQLPHLRPGMHSDGAGLYLQVSNGAARSWIFRFMLRGKSREMGLGPLRDIGLSEARDLARECRRRAREGIDPIEARKAVRAKLALEEGKAVTFQAAAERYIEAHESSWRNPKHRAQWSATLTAYAFPTMGALPVGAIDVGHVLRVLEPIWSKKPETAGRLRGRIEKILDWAKTRKLRSGENPARWRGHLDNQLPKKSKIAKVKHHAALPYPEIGAFKTEVSKQPGMAARALEFAILTAGRTAEVLGAQWSEIDLKRSVWVVPAERMKSGREHRVPLSDAAKRVLETVKPSAENGFVFPSQGRGKPMSNMAMLALLRRMGRTGITAHGFRASFRSWVDELTHFQSDVAEAALAHIRGDKTEAAYARGDLFEKRRRMMEAWAAYCDTPQPVEREGVVVPLGARA